MPTTQTTRTSQSPIGCAPSGTSTSYLGPPTGSSTNPVTQVVPNWNDPTYLADFEQLLAALGRRYDGDERLSVFEFSGYGDFSENHIAYLRDTLHAPGPSPEQSVKALGISASSLIRTSPPRRFGDWSPQTSTPSHTPN